MTSDALIQEMMAAYHEAGHAVAAHVLGLRIVILSIVPHDGHHGDFDVEKPDGATDPGLWSEPGLGSYVESYDVMLACGFAATEMAVGEKYKAFLSGTSRSDDEVLRSDAAGLFPEAADLQHNYIASMTARASELVRVPANKAAIVGLARNLLNRKTIPPGEAHEIVAEAMRLAS